MNNQPVVILTGASRGIGAATAVWLGRCGAVVMLVARSGGDLKQTAAQVKIQGGTPLVCAADVTDAADCAAVVARTVADFGSLDAVINNAGVFQPLAAVADSKPDLWRDNIEVNLIGPYHMTRAAIEPLRRQHGRIVNVSSGAANYPIAMASAYCAAKAGLNHFTRVLAEEEPLLTAVAVRPGVVDTRMQAYIRDHGPGVMPPDQIGYYQDLKAEGRLEPPLVPARVIAWLALHAPRSLSGTFIDYDDDRVRRPAEDLFGAGLLE
jgi:NAD(P)-dependent dehydrogenase (short-subunit alcohol dehydrogenase family)